MPTTDPPPDPHLQRASSVAWPRPAAARILVVDDEPVMGSVLRRIFGASHEVTVVERGQDAPLDHGRRHRVRRGVLRRGDARVQRPPGVRGGATAAPAPGRPLRLHHRRALQEKNRQFLASIKNPVLSKPFELSALARRSGGSSPARLDRRNPAPRAGLRCRRRCADRRNPGAPRRASVPTRCADRRNLAPPRRASVQRGVLTFDPQALDALVHHATGHRPTAVEPMPGGASTRRYLRVRTPAVSLVAMFVPRRGPGGGHLRGALRALALPGGAALLHGRGVRVPGVLAEACAQGLLLIEDLGDETLAAFLERAPARRAEIYRAAVTDLALAQRSLHGLPEGSVIAGRAFDETLLRWELDHFREWGLDARDAALPPADRARFDALADRLARRIAAWPRGFVHRDYQSRNLMVRESGGGPADLVWIDFQDALMGPPRLRPGRPAQRQLPDVRPPLHRGAPRRVRRRRGLDAGGRAALGREFDVVTVQRKLKDAGRFIFIDRVKMNPGFPPVLRAVARQGPRRPGPPRRRGRHAGARRDRGARLALSSPGRAWPLPWRILPMTSSRMPAARRASVRRGRWAASQRSLVGMMKPSQSEPRAGASSPQTSRMWRMCLTTWRRRRRRRTWGRR